MSTLQACVTDADVGTLCHTGGMLILHTSDWHLGRTLHGVSLGESADAFIDWLVALVRERGVDAVLISGDVFDRAVPPVDALARMRRALRELTTLTTVILTSGNHDGSARLGLFADMLTPSLHVVTDPEAIGTPVDAGDALVYPLPYLEPDLVRQSLSDLEPEGESGLPAPLPRSHQAVLAAALRRVCADLAARRRAGDERPAIAMPHAFVTGAQPSDSERDIQVGGVPSVSADLFDTLGGRDTPDPRTRLRGGRAPAPPAEHLGGRGPDPLRGLTHRVFLLRGRGHQVRHPRDHGRHLGHRYRGGAHPDAARRRSA